MWDQKGAYWNREHPDHARVKAEVHAIFERASGGSAGASEVPPTFRPMVLTGRAARIFREAQQRAAMIRYLADPRNASSEDRAAVWTQQSVDAFTRKVLVPAGRRRR